MRTTIIGMTLACGALIGCSNSSGTIPNAARLDSGISATGAAGTSGGAAAPPASAGRLATTPVR